MKKHLYIISFLIIAAIISFGNIINQVYGASILRLYQGGTGVDAVVPGDILVASSSNYQYARMAIGSDGQFLRVKNSYPYWDSNIFISDIGRVGIGTTSPSALLSVGRANNFTVNTTGQVTAGSWAVSGQSIPLTASSTAWQDTKNNMFKIGFTISSSSIGGWPTGSTTIPLLAGNIKSQSMTMQSIACLFTGGTTPAGRIEYNDGTSITNKMQINTTLATSTVSTNQTIAYKKPINATVMAITGNPTWLHCDLYYKQY